MNIKLTKKEKERKYNRRVLVENFTSHVQGDLDEVIKQLCYWQDDKSFDKICIEWNPGYEQGWITLVGYKKESDKAYSNRLERLRQKKIKIKEKVERDEKKLLLKLKRKYNE